jgi:hypothetical protein
MTFTSSVCDPALEVVHEVHHSNPVNPLEDFWDPEKVHKLQSLGGALEQSNRLSQIVFIDFSLFLIG